MPQPSPTPVTNDIARTFDRARAALRTGHLAEAADMLAPLLASPPEDPAVLDTLSGLAFETGDAAHGLDLLDRAAFLAPDDARLQARLADRAARVGDTDRALAAHDRAIALAPQEIGPKADKAHLLQTIGRFDEADALFRKLIRKHPTACALYRMAVATRTLKRGDPIIRQMAKVWSDARLPDGQRMELGFALAKAMEDTGQHDKVFALLHRANAAQARLSPFDAAARDRDLAVLRAAQDSLDLSPAAGDASLAPVFVVGLPRSGTTLVEQIVARHSTARAGGELGHALRLAAAQFMQGGAMKPLADLPEAELATWADSYLRLVRRDTGATTGAVTDKSIQSHMVFGLIRRALPGARLVFVQRDARDIALSLYKTPFKLGTHRYANDLRDIAGEIKRSRANVAYWHERMPDAIHVVRYEDLVSDPETHAPALLDAAGLPWEPQCLTGAAQTDRVRTLSLAQVRQPIHAGRKQAWRRYESEMQPFIDAWGDEPWD